jgi:hypothetical protein
MTRWIYLRPVQSLPRIKYLTMPRIAAEQSESELLSSNHVDGLTQEIN